MIKCLNESSDYGVIKVGTKLKSKNGIASVSDIHVSLMTKNCVITLDNGDRFMMDQLIKYIEKGNIEIMRIIKESEDILKDLSNITDYNRGFKDFDSLEKYLNSKGYEVADNGDDYIDIASPDGYRYSFDLDYSSEAPGGRLSIGKFIDREEE